MEKTSPGGALPPNVTSPGASARRVRDALRLPAAEERLSAYPYSGAQSATPGPSTTSHSLQISLVTTFSRSVFPLVNFLLPEHLPSHFWEKLSQAKTKQLSTTAGKGSLKSEYSSCLDLLAPVGLWEATWEKVAFHWLNGLQFFSLLQVQHWHPNTMPVVQGRTSLVQVIEDTRTAEESYHRFYFCTALVPRKCSYLEWDILTSYSSHFLRMIYKKVLKPTFPLCSYSLPLPNPSHCLLTCEIRVLFHPVTNQSLISTTPKVQPTFQTSLFSH